MSVFSKLFGKKRTVDTSNPQHMQPQPMPAPGNHNEQANQFNDFEIVNELPDGEQVAEVYLNVDTESKSRTYLTPNDIRKMNVGHTWLSIKPLNGQLPADLDNQVQPQTRALINAHGETAMGFWPVTVRTKSTDSKKLTEETANKVQEENESTVAGIQNREAKGLTRGSGTITREEAPQHDLHCPIFGKDTEGCVEEPDDAHTPKGRKVFRITRKQFRNLYRYIDEHRNHKYNLYTYNCTTFAVHALRKADQSVSYDGLTMPNNLYEAMYVEAKKHTKEAEKAKKRGRNIKKSDVELLKLAKGESHRAMGPNKEGEDGRDVRVKGVEKFDIPMFTDPVETYLKQMINKGAENIEEADRSGFTQLFFLNSNKRTLQAVDEYTQEAVEINLLRIVERNALLQFYQSGYNLIEDPRFFTTDPKLFAEYMLIICETLPNDETINLLLDGKTLSPEHHKQKLLDRAFWNFINSDKTGDDFKNYISPLVELKFQGSMSDPMNQAFAKALNRYTHNYRPSDLKRIQCMIKEIFPGVDSIEDAIYNYYKNYFNLRISQKVMTEQDFFDAKEFGEATQIQRVINSYAKIGRSVSKSQKQKFYRIVSNNENGQGIDMSPYLYNKAQKQANAPKPDDNEVIGEVYLNVDTTQISKDMPEVSRSKLTKNVGHTWLTIKAKPQEGQNQGSLPVDLEEEIQKSDTGQVTVNIMRAKGETAMGFYPLNNAFNKTGIYHKVKSAPKRERRVEENIAEQAEMDVRQYKGFTRGSGAVPEEDRKHYGFNPVKSVAGRVEEPDDAHSPKGRKRFTLTRKQFRKMYKYIESHRTHRYNLESYNCTTFATHALREAGHQASGSTLGICYPAKMYRELYNEAKRDASRNRVGDVQLLRLADNESHGEYKPGKIGETGVNVRVPGVDKFDMVDNYIDKAEIILRKIEINPAKQADYVNEFIKTMIHDIKNRTKAEAIRITDEAARLQIIKPKIANAIKHLYNDYASLDNHLKDYVTLPPSKQYDYLNTMKILLNKKEFRETFKKLGSIAGKLLEYKVGSDEYNIGCKLLSEAGIGMGCDDFINPVLDKIEITPDVALTCIHLHSLLYYMNKDRLVELTLQANMNHPEIAYQFIIDNYENPAFDDYKRAVLASILLPLTDQLPDKSVFVNAIKDLKTRNLIDDNSYNVIYQRLTDQPQEGA